jgi:ribonuclease VapC
LVVDTSALLAIIFDEEWAAWAAQQLEANRLRVRMSIVNYAEALILAADRFPDRARIVSQRVQQSSILLVSPTAQQAEMVAAARLRYPLNLGDCFAYALAKDEGRALLTLDHDFRNCDIKVVLPQTH